MSKIVAEASVLKNNGTKLINFSSDLDKYLSNIRGDVDSISKVTYGKAPDKLVKVYEQLDTELKKFVTVLNTLGSNVQISAKNMETVDDTASDNLNFEG